MSGSRRDRNIKVPTRGSKSDSNAGSSHRPSRPAEGRPTVPRPQPKKAEAPRQRQNSNRQGGRSTKAKQSTRWKPTRRTTQQPSATKISAHGRDMGACHRPRCHRQRHRRRSVKARMLLCRLEPKPGSRSSPVDHIPCLHRHRCCTSGRHTWTVSSA